MAQFPTKKMLYFHNPFTSTYQNIPIRHAPLGPFHLPLGTSNPHHQLASQDWVANPLIPSDVLLRICRRIQITFRRGWSRCRCRWCRGEWKQKWGGKTERTTKSGRFRVFFSNFFGIDFFGMFFGRLEKDLLGIFLWDWLVFFPPELRPQHGLFLSDVFVVATWLEMFFFWGGGEYIYISITSDTTWLIYCDLIFCLQLECTEKTETAGHFLLLT